MKIPRFIIAASSSGSGKTTLAVGLMRLLSRRGMVVRPFKCGPDYIDTKYHTLATGMDSINLDLFFGSDAHVKELFSTYINGCNAAIIEGVMGMYDGYEKWRGSSAHLSKVINCPVILVVNASSIAYSVAPLIKGFSSFVDGVKVAGVIFNMVGGESHYKILKEACEEAGLLSLGYIPKREDLKVGSRHLGLSIDDSQMNSQFAERVADVVERYVDIDTLLKVTTEDVTVSNKMHSQIDSNRPVVAVARDNAFNFIYPVNIRKIEEVARIVYFSPLKDRVVPECDLIYLPGGYPELFVKELSENREMVASIRTYGENGGRIYAECGGMIYLGKGLVDRDGNYYPMAGLLDRVSTMESARLTMGYRKGEVCGVQIRGHEFHYSRVVEDRESHAISLLTTARGGNVNCVVVKRGAIFASYMHLYWGECGFEDILSMIDADI